jgi:hypothetical protein
MLAGNTQQLAELATFISFHPLNGELFTKAKTCRIR